MTMTDNELRTLLQNIEWQTSVDSYYEARPGQLKLLRSLQRDGLVTNYNTYSWILTEHGARKLTELKAPN